MLVVMKHDARPEDLETVVGVIEEMGYQARPIPGSQRTAVAVVGNEGRVDATRLEGLPGVLECVAITRPFRQVSREWRFEDTVVVLPNGVRIGGPEVIVMAGPCAVESEAQITEIAHTLRASGVAVLRGGAFKPRSSPYSFQGLGLRGLELLARVRAETGMAVVTEALDPEGAEAVADFADIVQIGARNMQNIALLRRAGRLGKPVLLKRGMAATLDELLLAAEYVLAEGNANVILCERGVRSFDPHTRNLLDLAAVPVLKELTHLPVIADPSHGTGVRSLVTPMARAAVAAGADGILVEVHPDPPRALSDGAQSLYPGQFAELMAQIRVIARAVGRSVAESAQVAAGR